MINSTRSIYRCLIGSFLIVCQLSIFTFFIGHVSFASIAETKVKWQDWDSYFSKPVTQNKLLLIHFTDSFCQLCRKMDHNIFPVKPVYEKMNESYTLIRVDKNKRPDLYKYYFEFSLSLSGKGGLPLNVVALPTGMPIFANSYLGQEKWLEYLEHFINLYKLRKKTVEFNASEMYVKQSTMHNLLKNNVKLTYKLDQIEQTFHHLNYIVDHDYGGFGYPPKFFYPTSLLFIYDMDRLLNSRFAKNSLLNTLDNLAKAGVQDQIEGGFFKFSYDKKWNDPELEKLLVDNAQLVSVFSKVYKSYELPHYEKIIKNTIHYLESTLKNEEGYFSIGQIAITPKQERYFELKKEDVDKSFYLNKELISNYFSLTSTENKMNIPFLSGTDIAFSKENGISFDSLSKKIPKWRSKLSENRKKYEMPVLNKAVILADNALMVSSYLDAYSALDNDAYLEKATDLLNMLYSHYDAKSKRFGHYIEDGVIKGDAFLDDYAFLISAMLHYYKVTFDEDWLFKARDVMDTVIELYYDDISGVFFETPSYLNSIAVRMKLIDDSSIPAGNSVMMHNLTFLGEVFFNDDYKEKAEQMLDNVKRLITRGTVTKSNWARGLFDRILKPETVLILGDEARQKASILAKLSLPNAIVLLSNGESRLPPFKDKVKGESTDFYLCKEFECNEKAYSLQDALVELGVLK